MFKRMTLGDKIFIIVAYIFVAFVLVATLYPFIYIVSGSISDPDAVLRGEVWLLPKGFSLESYKVVINTKEIWTAYYNTFLYVIMGTCFSLFMSIITAYPLSRKKFGGRSVAMMVFAFTMFFSGGLIPTFLLVKKLHLLNTRWALVIPGALSTYNIIIIRTFFEGIPESLEEAATIDGCNDLQILYRIMIPLAKPIIAVMVLFYAVGQWNNYFSALVYLNDYKLYPLQMILRKILIQLDASDMAKDGAELDKIKSVGESIRYATIIVSTLPILCVYPFLQKYFVKGVMIGAVKG